MSAGRENAVFAADFIFAPSRLCVNPFFFSGKRKPSHRLVTLPR
jgi:hypothetical protein